MKSTLTQVIVAVVLVAVFAVGTKIMRVRGGATKDISLPETKLETLPTTLGYWKGEDATVDPKVFRVIGADDVLNRSYKNPAGKETTLHAAVFGDYFRGVPHPPTVCYPGVGWTLMEQKDVPITGPDGSKHPVRAVTYDMEGTRILIVFWYQLGSHVFTDDAGLQEARRALRTRETWPAVVKVLLQTKVGNPEQTESQLVEFGSQVYAWTSQLQNDGAASTDATPAESPAPEQVEKP